MCRPKSRDRSSSERYSESRGRERSWPSEGIHWQVVGFSAVVKKTKVLFAGVIKESEMVLEWSAEQVTHITQKLIDTEFLPTATNVE